MEVAADKLPVTIETCQRAHWNRTAWLPLSPAGQRNQFANNNLLCVKSFLKVNICWWRNMCERTSIIEHFPGSSRKLWPSVWTAQGVPLQRHVTFELLWAVGGYQRGETQFWCKAMQQNNKTISIQCKSAICGFEDPQSVYTDVCCLEYERQQKFMGGSNAEETGLQMCVIEGQSRTSQRDIPQLRVSVQQPKAIVRIPVFLYA